GANGYGQLGDGTGIDRPVPILQVSGLSSGVTAIAAAGGSHTCALTSAGGVKCWGYNHEGELGDGTTSAQFTPVDVSGLASGVTAITAGGSHSCALTSGGGVKCWGLNYSGQLGDGNVGVSASPVDVSGLASGVSAIATGPLHSCALTSAGGAKCWGYNYYGALGDGTQTNRATPVHDCGVESGTTAIATGSSHTYGPKSSGGDKSRCGNGSGRRRVGA